MIDFALDAERNEGKPPREAIYQACLLRFRPILMTTMAAVLGALPLMLGTGAGSELRHPLGISIVGGLLVSQLLTLFTTPVIYLWFDRLAVRFAGRARRRRPSRANRTEPWSPSTPFIRRPVATTLLTFGLAAAGAVAFFKLPVSPLPQVDFPTISVQATLPGASPQDVATTVASPLERHLGQIADVTEMTSSSYGRLGAHHPAVRPRTATSTAPRATCRPRSTPRAPTCRPACGPIRPTARSIPPTRRS